MAATGRAQTVVRRLLVYGILFAMVAVAATGLAGLVERAVAGAAVLTTDDSGLALSLAFAVIGVPLAGLLWWWQRRRFADAAERESLVWAIYLAAMTTVSLVVSVTALATTASEGMAGRWDPGAFATAIVWSGVWVWHRSMRRNRLTAPTRLAELPATLGWVFGLAVLAVGAIGALASLLGAALATVEPVLVSTRPWQVAVLQALVWAVVGAGVWSQHWYREGGRAASGGFAQVALVVVVGASAASTLFAVGTVLYVGMRLLFDADPVADVLAPLDLAIAVALIGGIVWVFHSAVVAMRPDIVGRGARLVVSGVALIGAASGFGVVVNALLATLAPRILDDDPRTLLLGGLSALVVGLPVWWIAWRPTRAASADDAADRARRVYLVTIFGASAVVAIVTVLLIGFRLFELALGEVTGAGVIDRIRAPLGLLSATAVVFGYHFAVWRHDRSLARPEPSRSTTAHVIVVAAAGADTLRRGIRSATGAAVSVLSVADEADGAALRDDDLEAVLASLARVDAPGVLVLRGDGGIRIVPVTRAPGDLESG
ncbi:hypothetical protein GCM10022200_29690 [Microbacterium awajiense]|uniref:DUF5671 domain-containing protein n=1 Tax=Microbacterium awajiense TaxID=415214 RepID=A0ABP7AZX9_9MICO